VDIEIKCNYALLMKRVNEQFCIQYKPAALYTHTSEETHFTQDQELWTVRTRHTHFKRHRHLRRCTQKVKMRKVTVRMKIKARVWPWKLTTQKPVDIAYA